MLLGAHLFLGIVIDVVGRPATTAHAFASLVACLLLGVFAKRLEVVAYAVIYVASTDVLWRLGDIAVGWESAKYAIVLVFGYRVLRGRATSAVYLGLIFVALLLPGAIETVVLLDLSGARDSLAAHLTGPIALGLAVAFFGSRRMEPEVFERCLFVGLLPIVALSGAVLRATLTAGEITFGSESNFATSGGFGPNQVSAMLGLGALLCFLLAMSARRYRIRLGASVLGVALVGQAALTFSRGGVVNVVAAVVLAMVLGRQGLHGFARLLQVVVVATVLAGWVLLPRLDAFTDGALTERFQDTSTTNRSDLFDEELSIFDENWKTGLGAGGLSQIVRPSSGIKEAPHTEYSRLLAEHGLFGVLALGVMAWMAVRAIRRSSPGFSRFATVALLAWSLTEMTHAATRIATIGLMFGLAYAAASLKPERPSTALSGQAGGTWWPRATAAEPVPAALRAPGGVPGS